MGRRDHTNGWRIQTADGDTADAASSDLSPALRGIGADRDGAEFAQSLREALVDGIRHDQLLQRIRAHFAETADSAHLRHTRRACLELQGRRRTMRPSPVPPVA